MSRALATLGVFINCPFDPTYQPLFDAMIFTVARCGFAPRCAMETDNGSNRLDKIVEIIRDCPIGIHDISRTELDPETKLPRFNMPFELGIFLGAIKFGNAAQKKKSYLVLDSEKYRYQKFISDIAGVDIKEHSNSPKKIISKLRDFLQANHKSQTLPSGKIIERDYQSFEEAKQKICSALELDQQNLTFLDLTTIIAYYLRDSV